MDELTIDFLSLIVASIGCITGIISLVIVLINNIFQIGKQRFKISERRKSYYFKAADTTTKGCYGINICAVVSIKATNQSSYPITIDNAYLQKQKIKAEHFNDFEFDYIEVQDTPTSTVFSDTEVIAELPLKLDPFETKYFAFAFPFFDDFATKYGDNIKAKLIMITPRKEYKVDVSISEYYKLLPNFSNNSISNDVDSRSANI